MLNLERKKFSLKKNDQVQVVAGREKGKIGKILNVDSKNGRVTIEQINMVKRHMKPTANNAGGIIEKELPLHYSNVLLHCPKCNRGVRHGRKLVAKSESKNTNTSSSGQAKVRVCKRCGETLDLA